MITIVGDWTAKIPVNVATMPFVITKQAFVTALPAGRVSCKYNRNIGFGNKFDRVFFLNAAKALNFLLNAKV